MTQEVEARVGIETVKVRKTVSETGFCRKPWRKWASEQLTYPLA
jgi:hypothetical protein